MKDKRDKKISIFSILIVNSSILIISCWFFIPILWCVFITYFSIIILIFSIYLLMNEFKKESRSSKLKRSKCEKKQMKNIKLRALDKYAKDDIDEYK